MCDRCAVEERVVLRRLARAELSLVGEIDRTEHIDLLYEQRGTELVERPGDWSASAWDADGHGEHSIEAKRDELLSGELEHIARGAGDSSMVVSATPSRPRRDLEPPPVRRFFSSTLIGRIARTAA